MTFSIIDRTISDHRRCAMLVQDNLAADLLATYPVEDRGDERRYVVAWRREAYGHRPTEWGTHVALLNDDARQVLVWGRYFTGSSDHEATERASRRARGE